MKMIFDTDGTLTNFNEFVEKNAIKYFEKKYGMTVVNPDMLEIQDIFDMKNFFITKESCDEPTAIELTKKALNKYWISFRFIKFSLFGKFRKGVKKYINQKLKEGHKIEIHTSRDKTTEKNLIGIVARSFTRMQYMLNGIVLPRSAFHFYKNDEEKINGIIECNPDLVFDDKSEIIEKLSQNQIKTICVMGKHNNNIEPSKNVEVIKTFDNVELESKIEKIIGKKKIKYYNRAAASDVFFNKLKLLVPAINYKFKPIILNSENLCNADNQPIIYAPNHRSTLDPVVITSIVFKNIHWAALLRFFKGEDSIFNNSKNPILCKITANTFKKMEYFPIDRKSDNPQANNFEAIKDMSNFLNINQNIGIFGEGTTRRPANSDFGTFDDSFILLAKKNNAWVQPITTLWIKDLKINSKVIVNIGKPFKIEKMTVEEAMNHFMNIQKENLKQNKEFANELAKTLK